MDDRAGTRDDSKTMATGSKRKILVVGAINRPDILAMFREAASETSLVFLEYLYQWGDPTDVERYRPYGELVHWHEFPDAGALLDAVRPDAIVLFYVESLNQVALKLVANRRGIRTLHLEHGARLRFGDPTMTAIMKNEVGNRFDLPKLKREWRVTLRNHAFFWRSIGAAKDRRALLRYASEVYRGRSTPEVVRQFGGIRQTDEYVAFSPETFEFHRVQDCVGDDRVRFIGIPYADAFAGLSPAATLDSAVVIDHQFQNAGLFGWDSAFKHEWAQKLADAVAKVGLRLAVKTHPGDRSGSWDELARAGRVDMLDHKGLVEVMPRVRVVLGTFSTMQLPLAALPHTCVIALEIHPKPGNFPSRRLVDAGVTDAVTSFEELAHALSDLEAIHARQRPHKARFEKQFLHALDGKASLRLREMLVHG